jgi:tetratricopeptide (TPR) repeat protein
MTDPLRFDRLPADVPEHEREARVEDLLLAGLDHYFAGQHELAINVWTRVLFLDRGHARARAYIERARGALSERQREAEELLHTGAAAFDRGDAEAARELLTSAVARGAGNEEALALLDRLDRLGPPVVQLEPRIEPPTHTRTVRHQTVGSSGGAERSWLAWVTAGIVTGLLLAAAGVALLFARGEWSALDRSGTAGTTRPAPLDPVPVPSAGEVWLSRARALHAKGRLHDALVALDAIRRGDPRRGDADELRAAIQRALLAAGRAPLASPPAASSASPPAGSPIKR